MGLSDERQSQAEIESTGAALGEYWRSQKSKGTQMALHGGKPADTSYANSWHPASRNEIRVWRPALEVPVGQDVQDHNSMVSSLGDPERFQHLWKGGR